VCLTEVEYYVYFVNCVKVRTLQQSTRQSSEFYCVFYMLFVNRQLAMPILTMQLFDYRFTKTWRVQNIGDEIWPPGCCLRFSGGDQLCAAERIPVRSVGPGCVMDLSVDMVSPEQPGIYESKWRMSTPSGSYFGGLFVLTLLCMLQ
jgi:hypothetical protein